jgi:hypothetical protein
LFILSFVGWLIGSLVGWLVRSFVYSFFRWLVDWIIGWFVRSLVRSFVRSFFPSFVGWLIGSLVGWFVHSFVGWFVRWFVLSFLLSLVAATQRRKMCLYLSTLCYVTDHRAGSVTFQFQSAYEMCWKNTCKSKPSWAYRWIQSRLTCIVGSEPLNKSTLSRPFSFRCVWWAANLMSQTAAVHRPTQHCNVT